MGAYQTLLNIAVGHGFYSNGVCSCLDFQPTDQTRRMLENTGLLLRQTADGIQLLYDGTCVDALQLYADDVQEPLCFAFKVYSIDPEFRSYTEPFAAETDGILYFDNQTAALGEAQVGLSAAKYVSGQDFKNPDANELTDVIAHKDRLLPPTFVLKLYAGTGQGSHLAQWLAPSPTTYIIRFNARQTFWKYYLLGKMAESGPYIVDADQGVEFEALGETALSDRRTAYAFRSTQAIPLHEHYNYRFQLVEKGLGGENVLINRLPVACSTHTGNDMRAGQRMLVSEIYINS